MKIMKGAGGGKPKGGGSPTRTPDSLRSADTVEIILGMGEGPVQGWSNGFKSLMVGTTPLENADGSKNFDVFDAYFRAGLPEESADFLVPKLGGISNNGTVNTPLSYNVPVIRQIPQNQIDAIDIRLAVSALYRQDDNGTYTETLNIRVRIKKDTDLSFQSAFYDEVLPLNGKTTSTYVKELRVPVERVDNYYQIEITKMSTNTDTNHATDVTWESYQMITQVQKKFADTATIQIVAKSTNQFSSIPDIWSVWKGRIIRVPSNYNPLTRIYNGTWDGTFQLAWSDNGPWILYDFITNTRYGMSATYPLSANKYEFYEAGKWCDQMVSNGVGGLEPRYTFNGLITEPANAMEMARFIAGTFNAALFDDNNGNIILRCDRDDLPATHLFTPEMVSEEGFSYSLTDVNTWYNDITVSFTNPDLQWNEDRRRVFDQALINEYGRIPTDFIAVACKSETEAIRRARHKMVTANTEKTIVKFRTNRLGSAVEPFEIILIADPDSGYALSGRVKSIDPTLQTVFLRDPLFLEVGIVYTALFVTQNGLLERTLSVPSSGNITQFTVNSALPSDFPADCAFTLYQNPGEGIGAPKPFRALACDYTDGTLDGIEITAIEVNRNKFTIADTGVTPTSIQYSGLGDPNAILGPTNVTFDDRFSLIGNEVWTILNVTLPRNQYKYYTGDFLVFSRPLDASNEPTGGFEQRTVIDGDTLINHPEGKHDFRILPLNSFGQTPPISSVQGWIHTVSSASAVGIAPQPVTDVSHTLTPTGFILQWKPPAGQEGVIHHYLVKEGPDENTALILQDNIKDPFLVLDPMTKRNYRMFIYAVSFAGVPSLAYPYNLSNSIPNPPTNFKVEVGYETIMVFYDRNTEIDIIGYRIQFRKVGDNAWLDMNPNGLFDAAEPDTAYEFRVASQDALTQILEDEVWSTPRSVRTRNNVSVETGIDEIRETTTQNLLRNGSFERELLNWTSSGATTIDDLSAPYIDFVKNTTKICQLDGYLLSDKFAIRPGSYYSLGADFKMDSVLRGESHIFTLKVYDQNETQVYEFDEDEGKIFLEQGDLSTNAWTRKTTRFIMPDNGVWARVYIEARGGGRLYIDGVQAQRGYVSTAFNPHVAEELAPSDLGTIQNPDNTPPGQPTLLTARGSFRSVILAWAAVADSDIDYYEILRSTTNSLASASVVGSAIATVYVDSGLTPAVPYYYWVRAVDTSGNIGPENAGEAEGTLGTTILLSTADYQELSIVRATIADAAIDDAKIANLSAGKITAGTITAGNVFLGSDRFALSGVDRNLTIRDEAGTVRVSLGRLGSGTYNYGLSIWDQTGKSIMTANGLSANTVGTVQIIDGSIVGDKIVANAIDVTKLAAGSVVASKIAAGSIETSKLAAGAVTADKMTVGSLSAITANLGTMTAGSMAAVGLSATHNYWNLDSGAFSVGRPDGTQYIRFNPVTGKVEVKGELILTNANPVNYLDIIGTPTSLSGINSTEYNKLTGIADGADVTSQNTAANVTNIGSYTVSQVLNMTLDPAAQINQTATTIDGNKITTGSIIANKLSVSSLSAITANIGTVTAGMIRNAPGTAYVNLDATGSQIFVSCGNGAFNVTADGAMTASSGLINGDMLVNGTISAEKIIGNGLTELIDAVNSISLTVESGDKYLVFFDVLNYGNIPSNSSFALARDVGPWFSEYSPPDIFYSNIKSDKIRVLYLPIGTHNLRMYWYYPTGSTYDYYGTYSIAVRVLRLKR